MKNSAPVEEKRKSRAEKRAKVLDSGVQITENMRTARKGRSTVVAADPSSTENAVNKLPASQNTTPSEFELFGTYRICPVHHEHSRPSHVYIVGLEEQPGIYKIGVAHNIEWRMDSLQSASPFKIVLTASAFCCCTRHAHKNERRLHRWFSDNRIRGEWFRLDEAQLAYVIEALHEHAGAA